MLVYLFRCLLCFIGTNTYYRRKKKRQLFFCFFSIICLFDEGMTSSCASLSFFFGRCVMSSSEELIELVRKLKRERSFVYAEQKRIREHYTQVRIFFPID